MLACRPIRQKATGAAGLILCLLAFTLHAQPRANEYQVKAVYLLNFGKFVTWPHGSPARDTFSVCVLGEDPFGEILDATVRGEKVDGKAAVARRVKGVQEASGCGVLFIGRSSGEWQSKKLIAALHKSGVLSVSDMPGFLDLGGAIELVTSSNRVRFEVNLDAAQEAGLSLSSELLKLASAVRGKTANGGR
jgi:YfiR/HmsC-like